MKTISKILSIVLVLSMILGFALIGRAADTTYTMIDRVADLTAGTYYMAAYLTSYDSNDWTANPYHLFTGVTTDLYTTPYSYNQGVLTIKSGETYTAKTIELIAVSGKTNTYYLKYDGEYLYSSQSENRKLGLTTTATEWVASNNSKGGITLKTTVSGTDIHVGTAGASSKIIRSYKTESTLKYGLVFFKEGAASHACDYTGVTPTYTWDQFKHTASYECKDSTCTKDPKTEDGYHTFTNKKCSVCGYQPTINSTVLTIPQAITKANAGGAAYTTEWFQVSGKVKSIDNATYGNLYIEDAEGNEFYIYGLYAPDTGKRYDAMDPKPAVGDTITVAAPLGTYNTTPQAKSGWLMKLVPSNCTHSDVVDYVCQTCGAPVGPAADSTLTYAEVGKVATAFGAGTTPNKYWVEGEITEIYNTTYGNMKIKDANGNILVIYGSYDSTGAKRYDKMDNPHKVGDKVKVYGAIGSYQGEPQIINGWVTVLNGGGSNSPGNTNPKDADPVVLIPTIIMMVLSGTGAAIIGKKKF